MEQFKLLKPQKVHSKILVGQKFENMYRQCTSRYTEIHPYSMRFSLLRIYQKGGP